VDGLPASFNSPSDILEEKMMRLIKKKRILSTNSAAVSLTAALLILTIPGAFGSDLSFSLGQNQDGRPDFSGKWKAESLTKEVGEPPIHPAMAKEMDQIDHKDLELKIIRSYEGFDRELDLRYTIGGKESANKELDGSTTRSKAIWNGKNLIITVQTAAGELKETWDLGADQKTLTITREFMNTRWKMVFKRL